MDISVNYSRELHAGSGESDPARIGRTGGSLDLKLVNLALQGGGAHGAFAWGVLDRLLEEKRIALDGISAASVGAVNATVLASGLVEGGRQGAKRALAKLWRRVAHLGSLTPLQPSLADRLCGNHSLDASPAFMLFDSGGARRKALARKRVISGSRDICTGGRTTLRWRKTDSNPRSPVAWRAPAARNQVFKRRL